MTFGWSESRGGGGRPAPARGEWRTKGVHLKVGSRSKHHPNNVNTTPLLHFSTVECVPSIPLSASCSRQPTHQSFPSHGFPLCAISQPLHLFPSLFYCTPTSPSASICMPFHWPHCTDGSNRNFGNSQSPPPPPNAQLRRPTPTNARTDTTCIKHHPAP